MMKALQKRPVAALIMVLAIAAGILLGQVRKPDESQAPSTAIVGIFVFVLQVRRERAEQFGLLHDGQGNVVHGHGVIGQNEIARQLTGSRQRFEIFFENPLELRKKFFR